MSKRAVFSVTVAGTNITTAVRPVLIGLRVSDKVGTHTDSADLEIDDTEARIILPQKGADVVIALGWESGGMRVVFRGTVDEVKSSGSRDAGRRLMIVAKGMDTTGPAKEGQQRHWDNQTVETILRDAASFAGIATVEVDPGRISRCAMRASSPWASAWPARWAAISASSAIGPSCRSATVIIRRLCWPAGATRCRAGTSPRNWAGRSSARSAPAGMT
jgi:hypothetical protein